MESFNAHHTYARGHIIPQWHSCWGMFSYSYECFYLFLTKLNIPNGLCVCAYLNSYSVYSLKKFHGLRVSGHCIYLVWPSFLLEKTSPIGYYSCWILLCALIVHWDESFFSWELCFYSISTCSYPSMAARPKSRQHSVSIVNMHVVYFALILPSRRELLL